MTNVLLRRAYESMNLLLDRLRRFSDNIHRCVSLGQYYVSSRL